jgi:hypothetical protein
VAMQFVDLDPIVRLLMVEELSIDITLGKLYQGKRLTAYGLQDWPTVLRTALESGNDTWLENWLTHPGRLEPFGNYTRMGVTRSRRVPANAAQTFAEGEFNRFYIRGVCRQSLQLRVGIVTCYRARYSENPRPESVAIEGKAFNAEALLRDLRENTGVDGINTALGMPPGPNSGMSVRL